MSCVVCLVAGVAPPAVTAPLFLKVSLVFFGFSKGYLRGQNRL